MQSRAHSLVEQVFNIGSGFILSLLIWTALITPMYDIRVSAGENLEITGIFTVVSILRGYIWRRAFNWYSTKNNYKETNDTPPDRPLR